MMLRQRGRAWSWFLSVVCTLSFTFNIFLLFYSRQSEVQWSVRQVTQTKDHPGQIFDQFNSASMSEALENFAGLEETNWTTGKTSEEQQPKNDDLSAPQVYNASICVPCPRSPPKLLGSLRTMIDDKSTEELIELFPEIEMGGRLRPVGCVARQRIAIVIPFRNRFPHLNVLLHNLIPFLLRQQADVTFFVIEQALPGTFNRGMLINIGFLEAEKMGEFDCYIFHDVDLVPLDDRHMYRCEDNPIHFAVAMNKFNFKMPYARYFGGIVGFSRSQFLEINGGSNFYFGWGGEDDDLRERTLNKGYSIKRYPESLARYEMIKHKRDPGNEANPIRKNLVSLSQKRQEIDGLNTAKYTVNSIKAERLYTWINVSINVTEILNAAPDYVLAVINEEAERRKRLRKEKKALAKNSTASGKERNKTLTIQEKDNNTVTINI